MKRCIISLFFLQLFSYILNEDPFTSLGIPTLNREIIFDKDPSFPTKFTIHPSKRDSPQNSPDLKSIEDLPSFLEKANLNEEEGIKMLSKFLIADDYFLRKYGAVYDQTGFDGISENEPIAPYGSPMRLVQRAKSAATIWYNKNYQSGYEAYGAEIVNNQGNMNWKVFKVLLIGKDCGADHTFVNVCIPLEEDLVPLVVNDNEECMSKIIFVENAKIKNIPYLKKIGQSHFFHKSASINTPNKPAFNQMQINNNPYHNQLSINQYGNSNTPYNMRMQNINPNTMRMPNINPNIIRMQHINQNNNRLQNMNRNIIQSRNGFNKIITPPSIIKPNLNINNPTFNYLNKVLQSNNRINILSNKTSKLSINQKLNFTSNSTSQFDEIKFFQNKEKIIPSKNFSENSTNLISIYIII